MILSFTTDTNTLRKLPFTYSSKTLRIRYMIEQERHDTRDSFIDEREILPCLPLFNFFEWFQVWTSNLILSSKYSLLPGK